LQDDAKWDHKCMLQKLGIATALLKDPPMIIMDEPTSGLDPQKCTGVLGVAPQIAWPE
jgi:ABC-2 type transport system ATP-binding protein